MKMADYTSLTIRKESEKDYQKTKIDYQGKTGEKISGLNFFALLIKKFREVCLDDNKKDL